MSDSDDEALPDVGDAVRQIDNQGYCVLKGLISTELAGALAQRCLQLHADSRYRELWHGDGHYQTLFGMINLDDRVWSLVFHETPVAIARHFLGPRARVVEACSKPTWPGAPHQSLHIDSAQHFERVPDVPWMINSIWALTDFTEENGATGVIAGSHRMRWQSPPAGIDLDGPELTVAAAPAGSLVMWHSGTAHMARANRGSEIRVGLNAAYYPPWFNNWVEGGHQPIWPETFERMPEEHRGLVTGKQARSRCEAYEVLV